MNPQPGFEFLEEMTSDLAFTARAASVEGVFAACAEALLAATVEQPKSLRGLETRELSLREPDLELLLLAFLAELIYLRDAEGLLLRTRELRVAVDGDARLSALLEGEPIDLERHVMLADVKAATAHGLSLVRGDAGWQAHVTLDV